MTLTQSGVDTQGQNKVTTYTYDSSGNLTQIQEQGYSNSSPYTYISTNTYNAYGQITSIDGPRTDVSDVTIFLYDSNGRLISRTMPVIGTTTYSNYDSNGNSGTVTDPNNVVTTYAYDPMGRIKTITTAGAVTTYNYDATGNLISTVLPGNITIYYDYDSLNRQIRVRDGLNNSITYQYDTEGNRIREEIKDSSGSLKKWIDFEYDSRNRLKKEINPDASYREYTYDLNGNNLTKRDANAITTQMTYDSLNRLKCIVPSDWLDSRVDKIILAKVYLKILSSDYNLKSLLFSEKTISHTPKE